MSAITTPSPSAAARPKRKGQAPGWSILVNFTLVALLCYELHYFNNNVYRFEPWFTFLKPEHLQAAVNWMFGFFLFSVIAAIAEGNLRFLDDPEKFFNKEAYAFLSKPKSSAFLIAAVAALFCLTVSQHTVQLVYGEEGERPVIEVAGDEEFFQGSAVPLFLDASEVGQQEEVVVTDRRNLYRAHLLSSDAVLNSPLFPTHSRIALDRFFLRKDFRAELTDVDGHVLAILDFEYGSKNSLEKQCQSSGFAKHIGGQCRDFFEQILHQAHTKGRFRVDYSHWVLDPEGHRFNYEYRFGPTIQIDLRAARATSALATRPAQAFGTYFDANQSGRVDLVEGFRKDMGVMGEAELEEAFALMWVSEGFSEALESGTPVRKKAALRFISDVLARGLSYVPYAKAGEEVDRIAKHHLETLGNSEVMLLATEAMMALSRDDSAVRQAVLGHLDSFVEALGTDHNASKARLTAILLDSIDEGTDSSERAKIASMIGALRRSARGSAKEAAIISVVQEKAAAMPAGPARQQLLGI